MQLRWIFVVQLWACAALAIEPGQGYGVKITWPAFVQQVQSVEPINLQYEVNACDSFTATLQVRDDAWDPNQENTNPWHSVPLPVESDGRGAFRATVDPLSLLDDEMSSCSADSSNPERMALRIVTTCADGRTAISNRVPMHFAMAQQTNFLGFQTGASIHAVDGNRLVFAGPNQLGMVHLDRKTDILGWPQGSLVRSASAALGRADYDMAQNATHVFVAGACAYPNCTDLTAEDPQTQARLTLTGSPVIKVDIARWSGDPNDTTLLDGAVQVPGKFVGLFADRDGSVLTLGRAPIEFVSSRQPQRHAGVVIARILGDAMQVEAVLPGVTVYSDVAANGSFLTITEDEQLELRNIRTPRAAQKIPLPFSPVGTYVSMSPSNTHWLARRFGPQAVVYLGEVGGTVHRLDIGTDDERPYPGMPAWLSDAVALPLAGQKTQTARIYALQDGSLRGQFEEPSLPTAAWASLSPALQTISGDRLVFLAARRMHILNKNGQRLGGTVMPARCSMMNSLQETPAGTLAWTSFGEAFQWLYTFDLKQLE